MESRAFNREGKIGSNLANKVITKGQINKIAQKDRRSIALEARGDGPAVLYNSQ